MTKSSNITLTVDDFFTDTRIVSCMCSDCFNCNTPATTFEGDRNFTCQLKKVSIDRDGRCQFMETI